MIYAFAAALAVATAAPQTSVDFKNFTYRVNPCSGNVPVPAVMNGGTFSYFDKKMGQGFTITVASVTQGSLGTGTQQAVVMLSCEFPIGGTAAAYLFDIHGKTATLLGKVADANWGGDWGQTPDSVLVRFWNGLLYVSQCGTSDCTKRAFTTYALHGGKLAKGSVAKWPFTDFRNYTYTAIPCGTTAHGVPLSEGNYYAKINGYEYVELVSVAEGTLSDGTQLAAVVLKCGAITSGGIGQAFLFSERGKVATLIGPIGSPTTWPVVVKGYEDDCKNIAVHFTGAQLSVDECNGKDQTIHLYTTYTLHAGKLTKVSSQTHKP
jgi:hypothetical protein